MGLLQSFLEEGVIGLAQDVLAEQVGSDFDGLGDHVLVLLLLDSLLGLPLDLHFELNELSLSLFELLQFLLIGSLKNRKRGDILLL